MHKKVILITDAVRPAGLEAGDHVVDGRSVVVQDGAVRLTDGTLAGSVLTMELALHNIWKIHPVKHYLAAVSSRHAALHIGVADRKGTIKIGKDADLVLIDEAFNVHMTIVAGRVVYRAEDGR